MRIRGDLEVGIRNAEVVLCGASWWDQSSAEYTPVADHHVMEWMGAIADGSQDDM